MTSLNINEKVMEKIMPRVFIFTNIQLLATMISSYIYKLCCYWPFPGRRLSKILLYHMRRWSRAYILKTVII